jgi:ADP-heptose:LPS heptosyltransferase
MGALPHAYFITRLQELAVVAENARFVLCHNGGFMHLAAAVGAPVIALFGPVSPRVWKPQGERQAILYTGLECSPCTGATRKPECYQGDAECKRRITVADVVREAERFL